MDYAANAPGILALAFWVGTAVLGLTVLLLSQVLLMRALLHRRQRRRERLLARWRPLIMRGVSGRSVGLPELQRGDFADFAQLWIHFHEVLGGESRERLNQIGRAVGLAEMASERLDSKVGEAQLLAILTLGHLGERTAWERLLDLAEHPNLVTSITAARALVLIDADEAMPLLAPIIERRDDWPLARIGAILHEAGPDAVSLPLVNVVTQAEWGRMARLIRLLKYTEGRLTLTVVRAVTRCTSDPDIVAACLQLIRLLPGLPDKRDAEVARRFLQAEDWRVRVQAALALGRVGVAEDRAALAALLTDRQWWVRYRAAQALLELPGASHEGMLEVLARQTDPFARDMLSQVLAVRYPS